MIEPAMRENTLFHEGNFDTKTYFPFTARPMIFTNQDGVYSQPMLITRPATSLSCLVFGAIFLTGCHSVSRFQRLEVQLSAFGVESDHFPNIDGFIDFVKDSSNFSVTYYDPKYKDSSYTLTKPEIRQVLDLLQKADLTKLKPEYKAAISDMPTCTIKIFTDKQSISVIDHGAVDDRPFPGLYEIVFRLSRFRE